MGTTPYTAVSNPGMLETPASPSLSTEVAPAAADSTEQQIAPPQLMQAEVGNVKSDAAPSDPRLLRAATAAGSLAGRAITFTRRFSDSGLLAETMSAATNYLTGTEGAVARTSLLLAHVVAQYEIARQAGWPRLTPFSKRRNP